MGISGFKAIVKKISHALECLKPLCKEVRGILFPVLDDSVLYTRTPPIPEKSDNPIIKALNKAIAAETEKKA